MELLVSSLLPADSPRLSGEDAQHARLLADSGAELPPIVVHRETLRVIDGMHRVRAARLRGDVKISAILFDGSEEAAFVTAVKANTTHGLPLSYDDREAATARIVTAYPDWSDRAIAEVTGLSAKTVGSIRRRMDADGLGANASRMGRDGRVRPLNGAEGRRRARELFELRPSASLREVAREAGIAPGTAGDVRNRMLRGEDPVTPRQRTVARPHEPAHADVRPAREHATARVSPPRDIAVLMRNLRRDPSIRFTESGRRLLHWLDSRVMGPEGWESVARDMPPHCAYIVSDLARTIAEEWLEFAEDVRRYVETTA
ncbi:ParB N-terminal domain-containing protein [Nonomuraea purpurea]|uniref:ParB N-terminal domain-containing protein n=1 Tax=Nonomuraea purpurea TaxID=1849276 RepID=A0ABV8GNQ9_9ACTN